MSNSANAVANEFIRLAKEDDSRAFTPLQLIKLVYIAHGWMLGIYQRPLIRERVEAWKYGPVIPSLYHSLKRYGADFVSGPLYLHRKNPEFDDEQKELIAEIFRAYGRLTGIELSTLTHQQGTPWSDTWIPGSQGRVIPNDLIAEHYKRLAHERGVITD
jgi:uncharacterized phage-associated protein